METFRITAAQLTTATAGSSIHHHDNFFIIFSTIFLLLSTSFYFPKTIKFISKQELNENESLKIIH
jgi:hypothetical protein